MEYKDYLETPHWKSIRRKMYEKYRACQNCGAKRGLDIHHNKGYKNIGHEKLSELRILCRECHYRAHRLKKGVLHWHPNDVIMRVWVWFYKNYKIEDRR